MGEVLETSAKNFRHQIGSRRARTTSPFRHLRGHVRNCPLSQNEQLWTLPSRSTTLYRPEVSTTISTRTTVGIGARRDAWPWRWAVGATGVAGGSGVIAPRVVSVCERELGSAFTHAESRSDGTAQQKPVHTKFRPPAYPRTGSSPCKRAFFSRAFR